MNIAVLRVQGNEKEIDAVKALCPFNIIGEWKKGDSISRTRFFSSSGFNVDLPDASSPVEMLNNIESFFSELSSCSIDFVSLNLTANLDVGLGVGECDQYAAGYEISLSLMELALKVGVLISLTAYPVNEKEQTND
ncbi:hypothetical protein SNR37_003724 [Agarivorans aestuarii]|uniref:DUF4279 domain-containing protein n=1 Tax=Agarivorans aestuarii TaxID=1563703 RepID=A0ABU7G4F7_9ALTE|nr:hypothetical protein [Agarivorans aestuarii]MEE1674287.1 hypothetical protein [Agarivorans aestuarii]